jgi:hypothetical protein
MTQPEAIVRDNADRLTSCLVLETEASDDPANGRR